MKAKKEITLLGEKVYITERCAQDVLDLTAFVASKQMTDKIAVFVNAKILFDALKCYSDNLYYVKRFLFFKKFKINNLISKLSGKELHDYALDVLELEGIDIKKKLMEAEAQSVETSQNV